MQNGCGDPSASADETGQDPFSSSQHILEIAPAITFSPEAGEQSDVAFFPGSGLRAARELSRSQDGSPFRAVIAHEGNQLFHFQLSDTAPPGRYAKEIDKAAVGIQSRDRLIGFGFRIGITLLRQ